MSIQYKLIISNYRNFLKAVWGMSLNSGFYESVINKLIDDQIKTIQSKKQVYVQSKDIDMEEGSSVLSKYMSTVLNKSLNRISGEDKLNKQIDICNKIINLIINELQLDDFDEFIINENAKLLLAVLNGLDNTLIEKNKNNKLRPITSIASNSLFTGAKNEPSLGSELVK